MRSNKEPITNNKHQVAGGLFLVMCSLLFARDARADIVVFKNGRTMSARGVTVEAGMATLALRDGGQVTFPADIIERVDQDEVPHPVEIESGTGSREPGAS